jgi:hypothetical protein
MTTNASAAPYYTNGAARIVEDLKQSILHGFVIDLYTGGRDDRPCEGTDSIALQNLRSDLKVFITSVRAGADKDSSIGSLP